MKIAYLIDYDINENSGVVQKILQQSSQWIEKGHTVYLVSLKSMCIYDNKRNILYKMKPLNINFARLGTALKLLYNSFFAYKLFKNIEVDIIYMRYRLYMPFFNRIIKNNKVILEINSDDTLEYKLYSKLTHIYNKYTRDFLLKNIDSFVSVSEELKEKFLFLQKPIEVIANGIKTKEYKIQHSKNEIPTLVFIGTPYQSWHGIDKILRMAEEFNSYQFYIIGEDGKQTKNIKYFGYLTQKESTEIIQNSDVGIGTLASYRHGLMEGSALKVRQYLACGLPVIYAYKDTDIPDNIAFGLKLKNSKDNMDYPKIEKFVEKVFNNQSIALKARKFAEEELDYVKKEEKRLAFFKKVFNEN